MTACSAPVQPNPDNATASYAAVNKVADDYLAHIITTNPEAAYFSGVELERHDGMRSNTPKDMTMSAAAVDAMLARLKSVNPESLLGHSTWITQALLLEELEGQVVTRVCRNELWDVNQ
ncbi:MAG: hypothetical protein AB8G18_08335, partial [Gammaproteobacteria bacterium]